MSKAVVYTGAAPTVNKEGEVLGEWQGDEDVTHVTIADGVTAIKWYAFWGCTGLTNLGFLKDSAVRTILFDAFLRSGIVSLQGIEGVRKIAARAFADCKDLRTIEGLGCEEMGEGCFANCTLLQSMKGWPASMTVIPGACFRDCTGMTTVDFDLSHVTSIAAPSLALQVQRRPRRRPRLPEGEVPQGARAPHVPLLPYARPQRLLQPHRRPVRCKQEDHHGVRRAVSCLIVEFKARRRRAEVSNLKEVLCDATGSYRLSPQPTPSCE
jgi:hypothetical protein